MLVHRLPKRPAALVFDIDNTLYTDAAYGEAQNELQIARLAETRGEDIADTKAALDRVRAHYALEHAGAKTSLANAFLLLGLPIETSVAWRVELLKPEEYLKPDAKLELCLETLARDYRLIALTNNPVEVGRRTLDRLGVGRFFPDIVGLDTCGLSKPSPEPFAAALERLGLPAEACVSVGDRYDVDLKVPLDMGMGAIQVDGVEDVYELPRVLSGRGRDRFGLIAGLLVLAAALSASAYGLARADTEAKALRMANTADGKLGARTMAACYLKAYPGVVTEMRKEGASGDWEIKVRDSWYAYAEGRWLAPERAGSWKEYRPYVDSIYPWKLIDPALLPEAVLEDLRRQPERQKEAPPTEGSFAASLYGGSDEESVYARQVRVKFLGWDLTVHQLCAPALGEVEKEIKAAAEYSPQVKDFVASIGSAGAYNWREIRGQKELSRHSYGIAIDILPKGWEKKSVYWQWDMDKGLDWALRPLEKRWSPPKAVVDIFEAHGFVWGGKWLVYDTMHFEYRPEILRLRDRVLPKFLSVLE